MAEANVWLSETLSQRKVDKMLTPTLMVMQRLHQNDPTGYWLEQGGNIKNIVLPAEAEDEVKPESLRSNYVGGLLDPIRLPRWVLDEAFKKLNDVGYAGQYRQNPVPRGGALFKVDRLMYDAHVPVKWNGPVIRYWDKAVSLSRGAAWTVGVKGGLDLKNNLWILDVKRDRWDSGNREEAILQQARIDGRKVTIGMEQEPASSGKESAESSAYALARHGFYVKLDKVTGSKEARADTLSVAVNTGRVILVPAPWNSVFVEEMRYFPNSRFKDQIDAASGMFAMTSKPRLRVGAVR
jgi:predicted phage terminase large subunit-like protein